MVRIPLTYRDNLKSSATMSSLRNRLLSSFLFLLIVTLLASSSAFILAISTSPAPNQPTYQELGTLLQEVGTPVLVDTFGLHPDLYERLDQLADIRDVRIIIGTLHDDQPSTILYDSDRAFPPETQLPLQLDDYQPPIMNPAPDQLPERIFGSYSDGINDWLFSAVSGITIDEQPSMFMVSKRHPSETLEGALSDFGSALMSPLIQSAAIGLVVATSLAILITRTIAGPLQAAAASATAVAEGNLSQSVPVMGPLEVRAVATAFNRMSAEVRSTQQAQQDFLANVSHDLKTPLTSIQGYSQAIIDGATNDPAAAAEVIFDEATRLNRMVVALTDLARMQAGQFSTEFMPIEIGYLTATVAEHLAVVAEGKGITLVAETSTMPTVSGDGDRLVQVLNNLIGNAIKYTPKGGEVRVSTRHDSDGVEIIIKDTGRGIPADDLPRIFERFYQVDKARGPSRGTGLGLAISHEIVQAHQGEIYVHSVVDKGTTFTVWLPLP